MPNCKFPTCTAHAEKNGYCIRHRIYAPKSGSSSTTKETDGKKKAQPKKRIRRRSKKLASRERQYRKIVQEMLAESDRCELHTPDCEGTADGLHHQKGRGIHLLNKKYLKRACNACNSYVERHPAYALEHGLSVSKHVKGN